MKVKEFDARYNIRHRKMSLLQIKILHFIGIWSGEDLNKPVLYSNIEDYIWETLPKELEPELGYYEELAKAAFKLRDLGLTEISSIGIASFHKLTEEGKLVYKTIFEPDELLEKEYKEYLKRGGRIPR